MLNNKNKSNSKKICRERKLKKIKMNCRQRERKLKKILTR